VLTNWDRGFDMGDNQVWGSTVAPYVLRKMKTGGPLPQKEPEKPEEKKVR
jgi:hypothetical protein